MDTFFDFLLRKLIIILVWIVVQGHLLLLNEKWQSLVFPQSRWMRSSFFRVQFGINKVVQRAIFFEELLVVQKVETREDSFEKATPPELFICIFHCNPFIICKHFLPGSHRQIHVLNFGIDFLDLLS